MPTDHNPKTTGITLLRYQVSSAENRCKRMAKKGIHYNQVLVSFPLPQAKDLVKKINNNKIKLDVANKLLTRLSNHLEADRANYNHVALKEITDTLLVVLSEIER
jgi:hypothetical protein